MVDFAYLPEGLHAMARAHRANTMTGHLGAALVAGYFFGEDHPDLDPAVHRAIEGELDRVVRGEEAFWFNPKKAGITIPELFAPMPDKPLDKGQVPAIAKALAGNIGGMRQSGHNVIFASLAVRALRDHPQFATPSIVGGIRKLIEGFNGEVPGRGYYGKQRGWIIGNKVPLPDDDGFPPYEDQAAMAGVVIDEMVRTASVRRRGFGGLHHLINHAAGLVELAGYGHKELAHEGLAAHRQHVRLLRTLPDLTGELGPVAKAEHDPRTPAFWQTGHLKRDSAMLTHRIKTLYGFFTLMRCVDDPARRKEAEKQFLYLMP